MVLRLKRRSITVRRACLRPNPPELGYGTDLYKNEDDRENLHKLKEIEKESILEDRF